MVAAKTRIDRTGTVCDGRPQVTHDPMFGFCQKTIADGRRRIGSQPSKSIGFCNKPLQFFRWPRSHRILEHGQTELMPCCHRGNHDIGLLFQVALKSQSQIIEMDSVLSKLFAVDVFGQIGLAAKQPATFLDSLIKRKIFKCLQCI